ncbi:translation initiation factor IF-2 [Aceticella autotrophica]|uniref:Translation initiation factor IF-2 n=2 Tax=Aceticella autotrophica TaxID=2755338 RepID=A0A975GBE8_9THEO|nr:translation initiation factor IF-2 [Aceticella autotrophica]
MSKTRVYELARELNLSSKDLILKLNELGIKVKNHMSTLEDEEVNLIIEILTDKHEVKDDENKMECIENGNDENNQVKSEDIKIISVPPFITVKELSEKMNINSSDIIKKLMSRGIMVTINQQIDYDNAVQIAEEYGFLVDKKEEDDENINILDEEDDEKDNEEELLPRPPVVTVMGHVDHGKTSLLDAIRKTKVSQHEAGGITQHIGASVVEINNKKIIFLDTPGHEAFTAMRARGASVTDIAILVVAADDGVMPQTIEAINHAKAANVPIIVAINKIDKPNANPDRVKQELTEHGLVPEDWGGDTICVNVSAHLKTGIDTLLEMVLLVAEMQELKANPNRNAKGVIIEAQLDKTKGPVATVLVQKGTLKTGDVIIAGSAFGKVRAMFDDKGKKIKKATPSTPVEVLGLSDVPEAGDVLVALQDEKKARLIVEKRKEKYREYKIKQKQKISLDELFNQIKEGNIKELNIILKADLQGSVEAIQQSIEQLSNDEVRIKVIHGAVGAITETDVMFAAASNAIIIGFNVRPDSKAKSLAEKEKVDIRLYRIIYDAIDDIKAAMKGMLEPEFKERELGKAEVRAVFKVPGVGNVAGCYVLEGKILRSAEIRIVRNGIVIYEGKIASLKRFKEDTKEVLQGFECGIGIERFNDIKEGDVLEAFQMEEIPR